MRMMKRLRWLAIGWAAAYFGDPEKGARRRAVAKDKAGAYWRRLVRRGEHRLRRTKGYATGRVQRVKHLREQPKDYDDATLADKVKSEVFRPADAPKADVNVNVANGVVELRGQVDDPELIDELVKRVRKVHGVQDVRSYLEPREASS
jgi:osmotically-inducible protein OsmY